jgi:pyruvate dehydrogenase (quinone)
MIAIKSKPLLALCIKSLIACRTALAQRGVSHLTIPIDVQEKKLSGKYSRHNVAYHTSDVYSAETIPSRSLIESAAQILNTGNRVVILVGQGALGAGEEVIAIAEKLGAPIVKALLGKAVILALYFVSRKHLF